ncbi:MAG TPA: oligosaccharide flippase family protein, partial [Vicinamibacterales bacterium]
VGLLVLPFNVAHLGKAAYGLWILTTSVTAYFSVLDLGYSGAQVRFVAHYRARRDAGALNEILSTMFCVFGGVGVVVYLVAILIAVFLGHLFKLDPDQIATGRTVLLIVSASFAFGMPFSVFGGVINGFQRYDLNNIVGAVSSIVAAVVNVAVVLAGYGLVPLVVATTTVRLLTYWVYRANAYRVFPQLRIRLHSFSPARLKEVTSFSVYMLLIDWANKINYSVDAVVIGMFLNTGAVAVWTVGQRLAETTQRLTNQLNEVLFPSVVDSHTSDRSGRLRRILLEGTRLSLASVLPMAGTLVVLARPLVQAWVGKTFTSQELDAAVLVLQILAITVMVRVGSATAGTLLKGAGRHRLLAFTNVTTATVNLVLSIALIGRFELPGVAVATLVPVSLGAALILLPAGCARVGVSPGQLLVAAIWPAAWPVVPMIAWAVAIRPYAGTSIIAVGIAAATAASVYAVVFLLFSTTPPEREFLRAKLRVWTAFLERPRSPGITLQNPVSSQGTTPHV